MKTILNFIVCFLLVAQLISSSYLLIHSNYKLSDSSYSINRMDLYQMKYENIADRLKRLATSPPPVSNPNINPSLQLNSNVSLSYRRPEIPGNQNASKALQARNRYQQSLKYTKLTMQTDNSMDQQPDPPTQRNFLKEKISPPPRQKRSHFNQRTQYVSTLNREREERGTIRDEQFLEPKQEESLGIAKVKSQSTLKMEEIMESFNNYKLNKEKLVSGSGKSHTRTGTQPSRRYTQESKDQKSTIIMSQETRRIFGDIDNIWNEESKKEQKEKEPQFKRSLKPKCGLSDFTDVLNETIDFQDNTTIENKPRQFSRGRIMIKTNIKTQESPIANKAQLRSILSPRGMRVPGKICKNNTRQFGNAL